MGRGNVGLDVPWEWVWGSLQARAPVTAGEGVSAGSPEAVYLLASSADGHWLAAVSGDWAIHIYNLKCFKVGAGAGGCCRNEPRCPPALGGRVRVGSARRSPPWKRSLRPRSRAEGGRVGRGREGSEVVPVAPGSVLSSCLAASLRGAHVQLRGDGPRHPPRHQQPRYRLLGPAGRSSPGRSLCGPGPSPFLAALSLAAGFSGRTVPQESRGSGQAQGPGWLSLPAVPGRSLSPRSARSLAGAGAACAPSWG